MLTPYHIRIEHAKMPIDGCSVIEQTQPDISWGLSAGSLAQVAYRIAIADGDQTLWDTGWIDSSRQVVSYQGQSFVPGHKNLLTIWLRDISGAESLPQFRTFCYGALNRWPAAWIGEQQPKEDGVIYFIRRFNCRAELRSACLFVCGIGYQRVFLNGVELDDSRLNPAFSEYEKRCYYTVLPQPDALRAGENCLGIQVAAGWRSPYNVCYKLTGRVPDYIGPTQLSAALHLEYQDGSDEWICTDPQWKYDYGAITYSNIFMGETFDASKMRPDWCAAESAADGLQDVRILSAPCEKMSPQTLEPVRSQEIYPAVCVGMVADDCYSVDFGQNIAGVCRIRLPRNLCPGQVIEISHMEFLDEDGRLYLPNLRNAACLDRYIARGDGEDPEYWQPAFTYHGFRYAEVKGYGASLCKEDICAISEYTDIASGGSFRCGNALINAIQKNILQTEKANIHSILTDCPQRDERMGWMNDATVRYEETPYNFDIGRIFPKIVRDLLDVQAEDGSITCTAPFAFGNRPADPVCSSFLLAGWEAYLHTGNLQILKEGYPGFSAWNRFLESKSCDDIVQYSYYGDWAAPAYACSGEDGAVSSETPGIVMSTGCYYLNECLLAKMTAALGDDSLSRIHTEKAEEIRSAFLRKWWNPETGIVATGSQGCQSFALWLKILPEEGRALAAKALHDDLVRRNYRFTTGNLCTRYLMDALAEYGYLEDAWRLLTSEEYPSFGFMIQQEATTIWERFELKKNSGMNSHNHPMFGAVGYWFYAYLAGIKPLAPGYEQVQIKPYYPEKLLSAQATVETPRGDITVRWVKRYGGIHLYVTLPAGVTATVSAPDGEYRVGGGFYHWSKEL
ncbi:MAG: family 78 glycoside hydrolase catalytic domain [Clostridiaceae bacterium]|nr:family 78 glycoside hydrolase catalytic domain [Clostridiaceae bacterium]